MQENVMIYEVKSKAAPNADILFSNDKKYFYWNGKKFINLEVGDYVYVVNKTSSWVLFTQMDKIDIETNYDYQDEMTSFEDNEEIYEVEGKYDNFIRLKVFNKLALSFNWEWKGLKSAENTYLKITNLNLKSAHNRLLNIEQLKGLTDDAFYNSILDQCKPKFQEHLNLEVPKENEVPTYTPPLSEEIEEVVEEIEEILQRTEQFIKDEKNILNAIKTKPFVLLAGMSGTGKSRLVRTLAFKTCHKKALQGNPKKPGNFELIPVKPNWHDSSELLGYVSRINGEKYIVTSFLQFIAKAWQNLDVPFFLCLDEMNLAPVEQYFAEFLSIIETRDIHNNNIISDYLIAKSDFENPFLYEQLVANLNLNNFSQCEKGISIPSNLVVIGTVNMDETTHSFSRKVLDRAMTLEMNEVDLWAGLNIANNDWSYPNAFILPEEIISEYTSGSEVYNLYSKSDEVIDFLQNVNDILEGTPFKIAYRVRDEFLIYCYYSSLNSVENNWLNIALDNMICMKILSRIEGDDAKTSKVMTNLQDLISSDFEKSKAKLEEMEKRLHLSGYTSFWS